MLASLAQEFRQHAGNSAQRSQILVTTHQPYFVDLLTPEEVCVIENNDDGFSTVRWASDDHSVRDMVLQGLPLGGLWYSDYLDARR